jgi:DNA-binding NarL/FixJ family response regulator
MRLRILIVDDHPAIRQMLRSWLELNPDWQVCGEASDGLEAVAKTTDLHPNVIIMDLDMPRLNGLEATRRIHKLSPSTRVLILTLHENPILPGLAREAGANGCVQKTQSFKVLTQAIESVGNSERFFVPNETVGSY